MKGTIFIIILFPLLSFSQSPNLLSQLAVNKCGFTTYFTLYYAPFDVQVLVLDLKNMKEQGFIFFQSRGKVEKKVPFLSDHFEVTLMYKGRVLKKEFDLSKRDCIGVRPSKGGEDENEELTRFDIIVDDSRYREGSELLFIILNDKNEVVEKIQNADTVLTYYSNFSAVSAVCYQLYGDEQVELDLMIRKVNY